VAQEDKVVVNGDGERRGMPPVTSRRLLVLLSSLTILFVWSVPPAVCQESGQIAGKMVLMRKEHKRFCVDKAAGHYMCLYRFEGNNTSMGKNKFLDNASSCNCIFADFVERNGPIEGYGELRDKEGSVILRWNGYMITVQSPDGKPTHRVKGSFRILKGTGKFANIEGIGSFQGRMSAWIVFIVEWEGEYSIRK